MDQDTIMGNTPKIYVIIVTYNGRRWYEKCFTSLRESTLPVTTIAIDNASTDGSAEYIKEHFPEVILIQNKTNLGFGNANNIGLRYVLEHNGDFAFLLNQDAWIDADMMEKMVFVARMNPDYGIFSPLHWDADKKNINMHLSIEKEMEFMSDCLTGHLRDVYPITYSNAAGWLLPRKTLETIGGFTPLIFHYGEDDDYMRRLEYHHLKMALVPNAHMIHDSKERIKGAAELAKYSNTYFPEDYIDPRLDCSMWQMRIRLLFKVLSRLFHWDIKGAKGYWYRHTYVVNHHKEIEFYRSQNRIKQPNWIQ